MLLKAMLVWVMAQRAFAVNPHLPLGQYLHTRWTQEEGVELPAVQALAQTADGYLWLGTSEGLMRFDGMRFANWSPFAGPSLPSNNVRALRVGVKSGLWVVTDKGLSKVDRERVTNYPSLNQLPCPTVRLEHEDSQGRLWMMNLCASRTSLALLSPDGGLQKLEVDGLADANLRVLFQDRQGNFWLGTNRGLCQWSPGRSAKCSAGPAFDVWAIAEDKNGAIVIADGANGQVLRFSGGRAQAVGPRLTGISFMPYALLCDHDGNIWVGTSGQGLLRVSEDKVDRFTRAEGLSGNAVSGVLEDREGDIWVATSGGIDRIRDPKIQLFSTANGLSGDRINAVDGAPDGSVWVATTSGGLDRIEGERVTRISSIGPPQAIVFSLYEDPSSRLWASTNSGLFHQADHGFNEVRMASGRHLYAVYIMGGDESGTFWGDDNVEGLFVVRGGVAQPVSIPQERDIFGLLVTRKGDVWLGQHAGGVSVLSEGAFHRYDAKDGLAGGSVRALYEDRAGVIWIGSEKGLSRFRNGVWTTWTAGDGLPEGGVQSIIEDENGGLWLLTPVGVMNVSNLSLNSPKRPLPSIFYGATEGVRLARTPGMTTPRLTRSRDGRLWVAMENGVAVVDPTRVRPNPVSPPVAIEQVLVDGKSFDTASPKEIDFQGHDLKISYTGNSLMVPERVQFRYRMDGLGPKWIDVGGQRSVDFGNLGPGHYRFHVIASNNDGIWNETGAEIALHVVPYFYQAAWFQIGCAGLMGLLIWLSYRWRMHQVVSRLQLINAERARFSRELHDSLLQGFSGVVLLLGAAAKQFDSAPEVSKRRLEKALDQADQSLREARQMITSMRIPALDNCTLPQALRATIGEMASGMPPDVQFELKGSARPGPYDVDANLFLIGREAVSNALNHAQASRIRLELYYTRRGINLTVQDNGIGFDTEAAMQKNGHWGFRGMQERVRQIHGRFQVNTAPGAGTSIEVSVPWK